MEEQEQTKGVQRGEVQLTSMTLIFVTLAVIWGAIEIVKIIFG